MLFAFVSDDVHQKYSIYTIKNATLKQKINNVLMVDVVNQSNARSKKNENQILQILQLTRIGSDRTRASMILLAEIYNSKFGSVGHM